LDELPEPKLHGSWGFNSIYHWEEAVGRSQRNPPQDYLQVEVLIQRHQVGHSTLDDLTFNQMNHGIIE